MNQLINIQDMSVEDKIRMMELLWEDLTHQAETIASPEWHEDVLLEREKSLSDGAQKVLSLDEARTMISKNTR